MKKHKIKYFMSGGNFALESILQSGNTYKASDVVNIKDINRKFGTNKVNKLKFISTIQKELDERIFGIKTLRPLNFVDYNKDRAFKELKEFCDFHYYGSKHLENKLTAFIQLYWLPKKFGVDKRTSHFSSMIISGQMTREEAIDALAKPLYDDKLMNDYIADIKINMHLTDEDFLSIMNSPNHLHEDFKVEDKKVIYKFFKSISKLFRKKK